MGKAATHAQKNKACNYKKRWYNNCTNLKIKLNIKETPYE